jgi:Flp pilus assembly protein TadG
MNIFSVFIAVGVGAAGLGWALLAGQLLGGVAEVSARREAKRKFNDSQKDRIQTIRSATAPSPIIYGRARVGGVTVYA